MNKQKFIELLRKPTSISEDELSGLENVTRQYPYFQSAHLLLAKASRFVKDPKTKKRINRAAVYSTDRVLFKRFLSGELIFLDSKNKPPINTEEELPEKQAKVLKKQFVDNKTQEKETSSSQENSETKKEASSVSTSSSKNFDANSVLDEMKNELEAYKLSRQQFEEYIQNEEEEKAVNEALNKAHTEEVTEEIVEEESNQQPTSAENSEEESAIEIQHDQIDIEIPEEESAIEIQHDQIDIELPDEEESHDELSFDLEGIIDEIKNDLDSEESKSDLPEETQPTKPSREVISNFEEDKPLPKKEEAPKKEASKNSSGYAKKIIISGSNRSSDQTEEDEPVAKSKKDTEVKATKKAKISPDIVTYKKEEIKEPELKKSEPKEVQEKEPSDENQEDPNLSTGALRKEKMKRLKMQKDIIDDFIDTSPKMPVAKRPQKVAEEEEEERQDLSADSMVKEEEVVSENMAIIYKNQGKIDKAIAIYDKLILKFPEKEAYFATRKKALNN